MMPAYQNFRTLLVFASLITCVACQKPAALQNGSLPEEKTITAPIPAWLQEKIREFELDKPANPPVKIYRYRYQNQEVYYVTGRCCDIPSQVFDADGKQLCQPDGGITGRGDGKCADFFTARTDEKLVWEDLRK